MVIYLISYILPPDKLVTGVHNHVYSLYKELKKQNIETKIITASKVNQPDFKRINTYFFTKIPVFNFLGVILFSILSGLYVSSKIKKGDIIHTHGGGVNLSGSICKFILGKKIKFYMTQHITKTGKLRIGDRSLENKVYHFFEKLGYKFADKVICVSQLIKEECLEGGCPKKKLIVIPNAIYAKKTKIAPSKDFYLFSGTNFQRKGTKQLLQAYKIYKKMGGVFPIKMIGRTNEIIKESGLEQLGWVSEQKKEELFKDCFAFLHPAIYDPCPTVVFEAMIYGKPIICFDTGGHGDIIKKYENGMLCNELSSKDMAKSMLVLEKNKNMYKKMSKNSAHNIKNFFWSKISNDIIDLYKVNKFD